MLLYLGLIAIGILLYAQFIEPERFKIRYHQIKIHKKLPRPFTILHLSDTHFARNNASKEKFFGELSKLEPDFIFMTGDIIDCNEGIEPAAQMLGNLKARLGKFAIFGNHDYWDYHFTDNFKYHLRGEKVSGRPNNIEWFKKRLEDHGVRVLVDENQEISSGDTDFVIVGTNDPVTQRVDYTKAVKNVNRHSVNILLTHVVDSILKAPATVHFDLALGGHTHGGQFRLPKFGGFVYGYRLPRKYLEGVHSYQDTILSVSRGLGASRTLSLRFFCPPEAIWIEMSG